MVLEFRETVSLLEELQREGLVEESAAVRVVGEERGRAVLFSWSGRSSFSQGSTVAFVGIREERDPSFQVLFEHHEDVVIVGASVNATRSLLAFTTVSKPDPQYSEIGLGDKIYSSYVAEIYPQGRCFALDVERTRYQRVQFLYPNVVGKRTTHECHMLFMLHGENIGMYTFNLSHPPGSDIRLVLQGNPRVKEVCKSFHWYQWDSQYQRLYIICFQPTHSESSLEPALWCFEFLNDKPLIVMNLPLPLPFQEEQAVNRPSYLDIPGFRTLQEEHVNLEIVSLRGDASCGSLFVCYQHPLKPTSNLKGGHSKQDKKTLFYSVCMLHHGYILKGQIQDEHDREGSHRLSFFSLNDYVVVFLPGVALHLLNCSAEHAPVHHILLYGDSVPEFPSPFGRAARTDCFCHLEGSARVLDAAALKGYVIELKLDALVYVFRETHLIATKLAILHMALVHLNDVMLVKMLLRELCLDSTHPHCFQLLSDYLIGSTYSHMKFKGLGSDKALLKLLPLTESEGFRGHLEMDKHRQEVARITYVMLPDVEKGLAKSDSFDTTQGKGVVQLKTYAEHTNPFAALLDNLRLNKQPTPRFSLKALSAKLMEKSIEGGDGPDEEEEAPKRSFFKKLSDSLRKRAVSISKSQQVLHKALSFLEQPSEHNPHEERRQKLLVRSLRNHLSLHMKGKATSPDKQDKYSKVAQDYMNAQIEQSDSLLRTVWTLLGYGSQNHPARTSLNERGDVRDCALFHLAEHFYCSVEQYAFPFPSGFHLFFTCIGFRCLQPQLFLQYVSRHVFHLNYEFLCRLISELGNDASSTELKFQILWRLNPHLSSSLLQKCVEAGHKEASSYLSQQRVSKLLAEGEVDGSGTSSRQRQVQSCERDEYSVGESCYMPLLHLMNDLRSRERRMADTGTNSGEAEWASLDFVQQDCLRSFRSVIEHK